MKHHGEGSFSMRSIAANSKRGAAAEDVFERKSRELVVPDDEIEAWELDMQDLDVLGTHPMDFSVLRDE
jgi:hypothetical protein